MPEQQSAAVAGWVGHVLAGHRIDAVLGEGGMGVVYRATHLRLARTVALKVLPPALAADPDYRRRFEREAAIAASLEHPNVVPIYDAGHAHGVLYLSMRFVDGEDLGAVLRREGRLDVGRMCALLGPVADALDAVHDAGLVHRDVKPGNILLARPRRPGAVGQVYLCDFGIAKAPATASGELTAAGQYMGTLHYSSPEQIEGRWVDGRSDQYGLACLVYRCLTGQVPYPRPETAAVIYAHLAADPPRPGRHRPDLPPALDAAVARAAAKHPDHRFPSCAAFVAALRATVAPRPGPYPRPGRRPLPPTLPLPEPAGRSLESPTGRTGQQERPSTAARAGIPARPPLGAADATPDAAVAPGSGIAPDREHPVVPEPASDREHPAVSDPAPERGRPAVPEPVSAVGPVPAAGPEPVPAPEDVRAERGDDRSITVTWRAVGPHDVEYKVTRLAADGRWHVVGRTRSTCIVDGAVPADAPVPVYAVTARLGPAVSVEVRSVAPRPSPTPRSGPAAIPPIEHLAPGPGGALLFGWPPGITEAMVVVRRDAPPASPRDPAATAWKITNMRYQLDGGLRLPASIALPCHVAVASCRREGGRLVVAPGFGPTARVVAGAGIRAVPAPAPE